MTPAWAICLEVDAADALGPLRCTPGIEVCERGGLWLRGADPAALEGLDVHALPSLGRYRLEEGRLVPLGRRLPVDVLPDGPWLRLRDWLTVRVPRACLAGLTEERVTLSLVRRGSLAESNLLMTTASACRAWAEHASSLRLKPLSVAVNLETRAVALRGRPLPPLPGGRFVLSEQVALPAGYAFGLLVSRREVASLLGLSAGANAVFAPDGSWCVMHDDVFIAATRSTLRRLHPGPTHTPADRGLL